MSSKINLQTCEYARKSSIFQDNQLIYFKSDGSTLADVDLNYNPNELIYFADQKTKYNDIEMSLN